MNSIVRAGFCAVACASAAAQTLYVQRSLGNLPGGNGPTVVKALNMSGLAVGTNYSAALLFGHDGPAIIGPISPDPDVVHIVVATGINNAGQIAGDCSNIHACTYTNGVLTDLGTLGGRTSYGTGINNTGQVTGGSDTPDRTAHAFIYSNGQMTDLGVLPGATGSAGNAINDSGQVTGASGTDVFLYTNGAMVDLGINGSGLALNNRGQVVGINNSSGHAFLYSNGVEQDLGAIADPGNTANGINNLGQVVGWTAGVGPFVYHNGVMTALNSAIVDMPPGVTLTTAVAINDFGQIVVNASYISTISGAVVSNPFLLTPLTRLRFVPVPPCRVVDTRNPPGPFGGPEMSGGSTRDFTISNSACGIPSTALAYSLNVTVAPDAQLGYLTIWPSGIAQPLVSTLNSDGRIKANAAIVRSGYNGAISVFVTDPTQLVLDINGYFEEENTSASDLQFYPVAPCRIADTRHAPGPFGGPFLQGGNTGRSFPVPSNACNIPATAHAYSMNFTAVPHGPLGYLTVWPTGQPQPLVSTLNAPTGVITANAAIVPAGANGAISAYASNDTDLVIDINGYFAPPASGGLDLFTVAPCRVLDTRNPSGSPPFSGPLATNVAAGNCLPVTGAQVFVLNSSVVPAGPLGYLTLWPNGAPQPLVSTLNALDGAITSNMAIVPATNGSIDAFASDPTWLIYDLLGYFAP